MTEPAIEATVVSLAEHRAARTDETPPIEPTKPTETAHDDSDPVESGVDVVDLPGNPLADWLTVPDMPVLPVWARSPKSIRENVAALGRLVWWQFRYHGVRTPKYLLKTVLLAARGFYRAAKGLWPVLSAQEQSATVKALRAQSKLRPEDIDLAARHQAVYAERTHSRRWRFGLAAAGVAAAATGIMLADPLLQTAIGAAVTVPLAHLGRGEETRLLDQAAPPIRVDMSAQQLNDALRAAGLLKSRAEDDAINALKAMLAELLAEMERRFALLRDLPTSVCPEGKLTPEIVARYNLPVIFVTIDELQEYFTAMEREDREQVINDLCRIARRGPAAGFVSNFASQRPDADSVPTKLREIITIRYSTQVVDRASSDMVLGKGKAAQGADASVLSEEHKGVGVLVTGPASYVTVRADYLDGPSFAALCRKGRALREAAGQLTGDAAGDVTAAADAAGLTVPPIVSDVLEVMRHSPRMFTTDLLAGLVNIDEDTYGDYNAEQFASALEAAGVKRTSKQVKISGSNGAGYQRRDIEAAVPAEILLSAGR
ncbi:cell division protein FtsK [Streptomyces sp. NPDC005389]|uniref:cell division protein FtsK n=1 Tax=Streptomyces sp. NPDC005389 TaxID=3157040 RepID=UPI0033B85853